MARVLIIDDDAALRQALAKHLEYFGHTVRQAGQGDEGIREFKRDGADLAVVDIFMPGQGGLQTIGRLRLESPAVKIVAMSGAASAGGLDGASGGGRRRSFSQEAVRGGHLDCPDPHAARREATGVDVRIIRRVALVLAPVCDARVNSRLGTCP